mmetsp:Transcript_32884/g.48658  ORF Transcript_32884/g.48658 Transcript_32884/m.48658 type:complete len:377 (+) Transcript_32884:173-1303(+)
MADSSDDFFNSYAAAPAKTASLDKTKLASNRSASSSSYYSEPGASTSGGSYYGSSTSQQVPGASSSSYYGNSNPSSTYNNSYDAGSTTTDPSANNNYGSYNGSSATINTPAAAPAPQVMNPYLLNSTGETAKNKSSDNLPQGLSGSMDSGALSGPMDANYSQQPSVIQPTTFIPKVAPAPSSGSARNQPYDPNEFADEPPLLEELGINIEHIAVKMRNVVLPFERFGGKNTDASIIKDADLAGPIALGLLLGAELLLTDGKLSFGYIYGFFLFGCVSMTFVLNFMSPQDAISFWTVTSILGYSLLPVNLLAAVKLLVVNLGNFIMFGRILALLTVLWCTVSSTRLMEQGCDMRNQRYLIAYPIALMYTAFVMITIF